MFSVFVLFSFKTKRKRKQTIQVAMPFKNKTNLKQNAARQREDKTLRKQNTTFKNVATTNRAQQPERTTNDEQARRATDNAPYDD